MKTNFKGKPPSSLDKFSVEGREVVIPLGNVGGDEKENSTCLTAQRVLVAKDKA